MLLTSLLFVQTCLLIFVSIWLGVVLVGFWHRYKRKKLMRKGHLVRSEAIILNITDFKSSGDNRKQVCLELQIQPEQGRNFVTEIKTELLKESMQQFHIGEKIVVQHHPENHTNLRIIS